MTNLKNDKRAKELADMINEICIMGFDRKDFIDTLYSHFTEVTPREKDDPCYIAIRALEKIKMSNVNGKYLFDLVRCMELESIRVVLDIITGHLSDDHRWGVFLLDKDGKPNTRIQEGELVEMMNWEDTLSKKYKKELKKN
jgi:hypothetical protein